MVTEDRLLSKQKRLDMGLIFRSNKKVIKKEGFAHLIPLVVITLVIIGGFSALSTWQEKGILQNKGKLLPEVIILPEEIDDRIAGLQLEALGVKIDVLTEAQIKYMNSWQEGT